MTGDMLFGEITAKLHTEFGCLTEGRCSVTLELSEVMCLME